MEVHFLGSSSDFWTAAQDAFQELRTGTLDTLASFARDQVPNWEQALADAQEILRDESARQEFESWIQEGQEAAESQSSTERAAKFRRILWLLFCILSFSNEVVQTWQNAEFVLGKAGKTLIDSAPTSKSEERQKNQSRIVVSDHLPVHESPRQDSKVTHTLTADTGVAIAESDGAWVLVEWDEICSSGEKQMACRGWVLSAYLGLPSDGS